MNDPRYPIGKFTPPTEYLPFAINQHVEIIQHFPEKLYDLVNGLSEKDFSKRYRMGGWNIRELIHHCADSHMNALVRLKLALTEINPIIKPYKEDEWAKLADYSLDPMGASIPIINGIHAHWSFLLKYMAAGDWLKGYIHPASGKMVSLQEMTALYAWHSEHHLAHIRLAIEQDLS